MDSMDCSPIRSKGYSYFDAKKRNVSPLRDYFNNEVYRLQDVVTCTEDGNVSDHSTIRIIPFKIRFL